ncbi:hypothetical protein FXO38_22844 [Capsicum annuum]|nr:hypothetical protein FXO38_22844 [Capsicum annuum]KAF3642427.1 hypothetical protein FXO37_22528 [Capsicum annuum]
MTTSTELSSARNMAFTYTMEFLGVLKSGSINFIPALPLQKLDTIKKLGYGLLNMVVMLFPSVFWDSSVDMFGYVINDSSYRAGRGFLLSNLEISHELNMLLEIDTSMKSTKSTRYCQRFKFWIEDLLEPLQALTMQMGAYESMMPSTKGVYLLKCEEEEP